MIGLTLSTTLTWAAIEFNSQKFGVRALGMGGAYTAIAQGPDAVFYNGAVRPQTEFTTLSIESGAHLGVSFYTLAAENPFSLSWLRLGLMSTGIDGFQESVVNANTQPELTGNTFAYGLQSLYCSVQTSWMALDIALHGNVVLETLNGASSKSLSMGISGFYVFQNSPVPLQMGVSFKNFLSTGQLWSTGHQDPIDPILTTGIKTTLLENKLTSALDFEIDPHYIRYFWGTEYLLMADPLQETAYFIRGGVRNSDLTLGLGIQLAFIELNYAYVQPHDSFEEVEHRLSVCWQFRPPRSRAPILEAPSSVYPISPVSEYETEGLTPTVATPNATFPEIFPEQWKQDVIQPLGVPPKIDPNEFSTPHAL